MATLKIEENVVIDAPVEAVWAFLLDPERVVQCLPGAAYDGKESDLVFLGHIKVKVGPVTTLFAGKATMSDVDHVAHTLRITGEGKDRNGAGTAKMVMTGKVAAVEGGAALTIDADVDVAGKLVTFGRGLIKSVSAQLFKQFSARAQEMLAQAPAPAPEPAPAEPVAPAAAAEVAAEAAAPAEAAAAEAAAPEPAPAEPVAPAAADGASEPAAPVASAAPRAPLAPAVVKPRPVGKPPAKEESLNALGLLFRALASSIADFFRRLLGRKPR